MAHTALLGLVYLSFISIGLPDGMLGVAWPAMRLQMDQPLAAVGAITMTMTACSAAASLLAGSVVQRIGTGAVVAGSCLLTALGLLGFAVAPSFGWLVALAIPLGVGAGAVDASLNHFVSAHYSSRHMNWLHGFWGVGATTGPLVMGAALASEGGWTAGARSIGLMQLGLALVLFATVSLWSRETAQAPADEDQPGQPAADRKPPPLAMWLAPLCFLFYVSAEMGTGLWAASILVTDRGLSAGDASVWVSLYFGAITVGRFAVGLVANRVGNRRLVRLGIVVAMAGALVFALPAVFGAFSPVGLVIMGLGCAPIFPSLMHETARRFPPEVVRKLIGRQMTCAYAGSSVVPAAFGLLATWAGLQTVMPVVVVLLLVLLLVTSRLDRLT
jgi:fucose permease